LFIWLLQFSDCSSFFFDLAGVKQHIEGHFMEKSKNNGLPPVFAAIAIQLTLGVAYIWSVFQTGVANSIFKGDNAAASLTFH